MLVVRWMSCFIRIHVKLNKNYLSFSFLKSSYGWENQIEEVLLEMVSTGKIDLSMQEIRQVKTYLLAELTKVTQKMTHVCHLAATLDF